MHIYNPLPPVMIQHKYKQILSSETTAIYPLNTI